MRGFLTIFLALSIIFFAPKVLAQENPLDEAVSISHNDRAPFDGIILPIELAIQLGLRIENLQRRLTLDVEREQQLCSAQLAFETRRRELEQERSEYQIRLLEDRVLEQAAELAEPIPWYRRWGFAFGMGILTSSLLVAGGIALILGVM